MNDDRKSSLHAWLIVLALTGIVYAWMRTGGTFTHWSRFATRYSEMADGFLHGRLSLRVQPAPELLALPNPFDPVANAPYQLHDASLYNGKYYYYWGPVPALIAAGVCKLIGVTTPAFGDETIGFILQCGAALIMAALLFQVRAKIFPDQPAASAVPSILTVTLATCVLSSVNCLSIYEAAIFAGQFFLLAGVFLAWTAIKDGRPRYGLLAAASGCWALSAGSRVSLPPALAVLAAFTLWYVWHSGIARSSRSLCAAAAALILPLAAAGILLGWYNYARFGSILETGASLTLSGQDQRNPTSTGFVSWRNVGLNGLAYLFTLPHLSGIFPYFQATDAYHWLSRLFRMPARYLGGEIPGLLWTEPFLLLAPLAVIMRRKKTAEAGDEAALEKWLVLCSLVAGTMAMVPAMAIGMLAVRYLVDGVPLLTVAAAVGYWRLLERFRDRPKAARELRGVVRAVIALQVIIGLFLAISRSPAAFSGVARHFPFF